MTEGRKTTGDEREPSAFWQDLNKDLRDPDYRREYEAEAARIAAIDAGRENPCCDDGPAGHTEQQHHDASDCYVDACPLCPAGREATPPAWVCFDCGFTADGSSDGWHECVVPVSPPAHAAMPAPKSQSARETP